MGRDRGEFFSVKIICSRLLMPVKDSQSFFIYVIYDFTSGNQSNSARGGGRGGPGRGRV